MTSNNSKIGTEMQEISAVSKETRKREEKLKNFNIQSDDMPSTSSKIEQTQCKSNESLGLKSKYSKQKGPNEDFLKDFNIVSDMSEAKVSSINDPMECKNLKSNALVNLSRKPVNCPVTECKKTVGMTSVLAHFLKDHKLKIYELEAATEATTILRFSEEDFKNFNENVCFGVLTYAGKSQYEESRPGVIGLCRPNFFLPAKHLYLVNHLPILVMGCKTSLTSVLEDKDLAEELTNLQDPFQQIIVIWLATVETTKKMHCTITAFNRLMFKARGIRVEVRSLKQTQDPRNFMSMECDYLMLSRGEIDILSKKPSNDIDLEIVVHDFDEQ